MNTSPFFQTIYNLRLEGQVILYGKKYDVREKESDELADFLESEYEKEYLDFPSNPPIFNRQAAVWGATIVYRTAHLLVHRDEEVKEMQSLLPNFSGRIDASAMISADLCLRFVPQLLAQLQKIDEKDAVVPILKRILNDFHFTAIGYDILEIQSLDFDAVFGNACLRQLYLDRVWQRQHLALALLPKIGTGLSENFGDYTKEFWPNLLLQANTNAN